MSNSNLSFHLSNPDPRTSGKAMLYKTEDTNSLVLTIKNKGVPIALKAGAPVGENNPDPAGASSLYITFANLLEQGATDMREVKVSLPGWKAVYSSGEVASWALTPEQNGTLAEGAELTVTIEGILPNPKVSVGVFSIDYYNLPAGGAENWQVNVQVADPPAKGKGSLENKLSAYWLNSVDSIFVTPSGQPAIANELDFTLFYSGANEIKGTNRTKFSFYFIYDAAPGYGALCTKKEADGIDFRTVAIYGNGWMGGKNAISSLPMWDFRFRGTVFGAGDNSEVDFKVSELKSTLQPGTTQLFIAWNNVPDYNDGQISIPIRKNMPPIIESFTASPANLQVANESAMVPVTIKWEVQNCDSIAIDSETGFAATGETTVLMGYGKQEVLLTALFGGSSAKPVKQWLKVPVTIAAAPDPVFDKFSLSPQNLYFVDDAEYEVKVEWAVRHASEVFFEDGWLVGVTAFNGSRLVSIPFEKFRQIPDRPDFWSLTMKLNAVNLGNTQTFSKSVDLLLSRHRLYEDKLSEIVGVMDTFNGTTYLQLNRESLSSFIVTRLQAKLIPIVKDMALREVGLLPKLISFVQAYLDTKGKPGELQELYEDNIYVSFLQMMNRIKEYLAFDWHQVTNNLFPRNKRIQQPVQVDYSPGPVDSKGRLDANANYSAYEINAFLVVLSYRCSVRLDFRPDEASQQLQQFLKNSPTSNFENEQYTAEKLLKKLNVLSEFIHSCYPRFENIDLYNW